MKGYDITETKVLKPDEEALSLAAKLLSADEIVAVPTETVYGLAANAYSPAAVRKIFEAKGRPQDNPLILHIADFEMLSEIAVSVPPLAYELAEAFWPGPLTMIFDKTALVPDETSGGLKTAAVRMPNCVPTLDLIRRCGFPLAAPSANTSGLPSPTQCSHVYDDMNGKIPLIIDGGECFCGVESTVLCFTEKGVKILRPGVITPEMLREYTAVEVDDAVLHMLKEGQTVLSPGMKYKHYSPKADVFIVSTKSEQLYNGYVEKNDGDGVYALTFSDENHPKTSYMTYGKTSEEQARHLFARLRELDERGAKKVFVREPHKDGVGLAVYNRLLRSAAFRIINVNNGAEND